MASRWAVVVAAAAGGILGVAGTLASTWLSDYLKNRRSDKLDDARKKILRQMLEDQRFEWRKVSTLAHVIRADVDQDKRLLLEIDARASEDGTDMWGLVSRHPFPTSN